MPAAKKPRPSASMTMSSMGCSCAIGIARPNWRHSRLMGVKCHRVHRFSRRERTGRYRNLIKAAASTGVVPANAGTHTALLPR
jgi:hypothetical protein